jgi:hypothetical protein
MPPAVADFFRSPQGQEWLQTLLLALVFVVVLRGGGGVSLVRQILQLTGLGAFFAHSPRTLQRLARAMTTEVGAWGDREEKRLAAEMPWRYVVLCPDEQFHDGLCLTMGDALSGYLFLEQKATARDEKTWTGAAKGALGGFFVQVLCVCSDNAGGLHGLAVRGLEVPHDVDGFHEQHAFGQPFTAPIARRVRTAQREVQLVQQEQEELRKEKQAASSNPARAGRPKNWDEHEQRVAAKLDRTKKSLAQEQALQQSLRAQVRHLGEALHPVDLHTGAWKTGRDVDHALCTVLAKTRALSKGLGSEERKEAAYKRLVGHLDGFAARVQRFHDGVRVAVQTLSVAESVRSVVLQVLVPYLYLVLCLKRTERAEERKTLRQTLLALRSKLCEPGGPWQALAPSVRTQLRHFAEQIARTYVRASSGTEGRNGRTALLHHQRHRLTDADLKAQRVLHNFVVQRPDGTTAAERLFGQKPHSLFFHLRRTLRVPGPPRQGHPSKRREDHVTPLGVAV